MELPPAIAELGPFEYDSKFRTWTARDLLRGAVFTGDVQFGVFSSTWPPPQPDDRMRQAFDQCRLNWGTLEARARTRVIQAFREFAAYFPGWAEEMGLAADAPEEDILAHAGSPTLLVTHSIYTPRDEDYEVAIRFPVAWDEEHGLEIPVVEGEIPGAAP